MTSLASFGLAALALATATSAHNTGHCYQVSDEYNAGNFFDKFSFFESKHDTGHYNDVDPTSGYVSYRNQKDAAALGLIKTDGSDVYLGVNYKQALTEKKGPDSVKLVSKQTYDKGLIIADFAHLPKPACGQWPAFWMTGDVWPAHGELDIFEPYNEEGNSVVMHADHTASVGSCKLVPGEMTGKILTENCDNYFENVPLQYKNQGGGVRDNADSYWTSAGSVYATEWSSQNISVWSWARNKVPADVLGKTPNPRGWGPPSFFLGKSSCNIDKVMRQQRLVLNINFCGDLAGNEAIWANGGCGAKTKALTCKQHVMQNPGAFSESFFKIKGIKYFEYKEIVADVTKPGGDNNNSGNNGGSGNGGSSNGGSSNGNGNGGHGPFSNSTMTTSSGVTSTAYSTSYYTVTKCPATVTNCPLGQVTSTVIPTGVVGSGSEDCTIVNGKDGYIGTVGIGGCGSGGCGIVPVETGAAGGNGGNGSGHGAGNGSGEGSGSGAGTGEKPGATPTGAVTVPKPSGAANVTCSGPNCTKIVVSGAGIAGVSGALTLAVVGAMTVLLM